SGHRVDCCTGVTILNREALAFVAQSQARREQVSSVAASTVPDMSSLLEADNASDSPPGSGARVAVQQTFDELGRPLRDTTFVVVDLETTGGSAAGGSSITGIGAGKCRGVEVQSEFQTLVRPSEPIPAFISVLTGITNAMVADAPRIEAA